MSFFDLQTILAQFSSLLMAIPFPRIGLTYLDFIIVFVILFYAYEGIVLGLLLASVDLMSFLLSFVIALKGYSILGSFLSEQFSLPPGVSNAISFFVIALVTEIVLSLVFRYLLRKAYRLRILQAYQMRFSGIDHYLGILPGIASAFIILSFLLTVIISLPSSPLLKQAVTNSLVGSRLVTHAAIAEKTLNDVFGGALHETLNFLTIEPESNETLALRFTVSEPIADPASEQEMLAGVNRERKRHGLAPVVMDPVLRTIARSYAKTMLQEGFFSHFDRQGNSPFDRMDKAGISYLSAGENLALAPNTQLAMQGLMNSPGHRANILSPNFGHVGIGVMDGGIYGKMFVQEFTD
ncbi:MAG: CvpA family protein [Candidatus Levybacteria bacterium]|nr:CvpA family protein [Candidatus Levybacteria bacterium]